MDIMSSSMSICFIYWYILFDIVTRALQAWYSKWYYSPLPWYSKFSVVSKFSAIFFLFFDGYVFVPRYGKVDNFTLPFACRYKLWLPVLCNFICLNIEVPKEFFICHFPGLVMVCVPFVTIFLVIFITQQPVHIGPNLVMTFSILKFSQNWTRTDNMCYTFCLFITEST